MTSGLGRFVPHLGRAERAARWRGRGRPRVWAHRGASALAPENTMAAFERARTDGADGIELDVRFDADDTVVVFHDDDLARLAHRAGRMEQLSASERRGVRVGGEPVPTLAEVMDWLGDLEINVEIKSNRRTRTGALAAATGKVLRESRRTEQVIVSSFDPFALVALHPHVPDVALAYLFHDEQPLPLRKGWLGGWLGASVLHPQNTLCTEHSVRAWHHAGFPVNVWTVDDPAELKRLALLGVDGVFANDPAAARRVFDEAA